MNGITFQPRVFWNRLKGAWPAGLFIAVVAAGVMVAWGTWALGADLADSIRYSGTAVQICGLLTIAKGLRDLRRWFRQPPALKRIKDWFAELASALKKPQKTTVTPAPVVMKVGVGGGRVISKPSGEAGLSERVAYLERELEHLRSEVRPQMKQNRRRIEEVRSELKREGSHRQKDMQSTKQLIEEISIGGLHLEWVGLLWLLLGLIATCLPVELATALSGLP
jgi:hypothetical protein